MFDVEAPTHWLEQMEDVDGNESHTERPENDALVGDENVKESGLNNEDSESLSEETDSGGSEEFGFEET
jgi:hypothetical protein